MSQLHDSNAWETVSGWVFGCRTCLEHTVCGTQTAALARKQVHDSRALPWWVERIKPGAHTNTVGAAGRSDRRWPCSTRGPFCTHVCLTCSPDSQTPGPECHNCRNTGMDQTPCQPARPKEHA